VLRTSTGLLCCLRACVACRTWCLDVGPIAAVVAVLWAKLVYFTALLPSAWWAPEETIRQWMRPSFFFVDVLWANPYVLSFTLAVLLLVVAPLPLLPRLPVYLGLLALNLVLTSLGLVDFVHAHFYADVVSVSDVIMAPIVVGVLPRFVEALPVQNALYYLDILVGLLLLPWYRSAYRGVPRLERRSRARVSLALLGTGLLLVTTGAGVAWRSGRELLGYSSLRIEVVSVIGILPYHVGDLVVRLTGAQPRIGESERQLVVRVLDERPRTVTALSPLFGRARGQNVIVINAESLQAFPIGMAIDGRSVTPRLSAFARESLHFLNFYDQTHLGTTSDAEFAVLHSLHPLANGVLSNHFSGNRYRGLPRVLAEHGYATLSACAAPGDFWNMATMHPALGFQRSIFEDSYRLRERIGPWLSDREFFAQTVPTLKAQPTPFMAFLLTASNHHPYRLPAEDKELSLGTLEGTLLGDYLQSVRYFDRAFGEFVDRLREVGLLDTSIVVLYGDHQGFLGDPPDLAHLLGFPERDEYRTLQVRKKVPLLIRLPHAQEAGARAVTGGHVDIAPTVLGLLGIEDEHGVMLGRDLTQGQHSLVVFRDGSFTDGRVWYVHRVGAVVGTCYEVDTGRAIDCSAVDRQRREALERLKVSDLIVRGDLIPALAQRSRR
jgi:lipoteichoic acid synthase